MPIVFAAALPHTPQLLVRPDTDHPYLVFMAGLRLRTTRDPGAFERF